MSVIELPLGIVPFDATTSFLDFGGWQKPGTGGRVTRVDRKGSRYRAALLLRPLESAREGRVVVSRLIRAKRLGLRVPFPLPGPQGVPGFPLIDGADQAGTSISVRALTPNYAVREGYWLSIEAADGTHYLHNVTEQSIAGADGRAVVGIEPELRIDFADGARVHIAKPMIEGIVFGNEQSWNQSVDALTTIEFTIEEAG